MSSQYPGKKKDGRGLRVYVFVYYQDDGQWVVPVLERRVLVQRQDGIRPLILFSKGYHFIRKGLETNLHHQEGK